jgi:hypothetical protein
MPAISASEATVILSAATATGAGQAYSMPQRPSGGVTNRFSWQVVLAGSFSGVEVDLQGSNDGTNWVKIDNTTNTAGDLRQVVFPVAQVRANVVTFTGGTSVTVTLQPGE